MSDQDGQDSESPKAREMVAKFLSLAGFEDHDLTREAGRLLHGQITAIGEQGLRESDLAVMGQAYIRAVGRVVGAESEAISRLRQRGAGQSEDRLEAVADRLLPLGRDVFDVLHSLLLRRAVTAGSQLDRSRRSVQPAAVAHVDVVNSTALLERASLSDTQRLVDGLFASAQAAIRGRPVEVVKYVGDGVFLAGSDALEVAAASLDCVASLAADVGLTARAGLAYGRVVHRAGDMFGLPVNLSHALTKRASPGALLAAGVGEARLPTAMCTIPRTLEVRGLNGPLIAYEVVAVS